MVLKDWPAAVRASAVSWPRRAAAGAADAARAPELRHAAVVVLGFAALFAAVFSPLLASGKLLMIGDCKFLYYPAVHAEPGLWNPLLFSGYPRHADPQNMAWYPPARLARLGAGWWNAFIISAYVLAACGMYGYARRLTGSAAAGAAAGVAYSMSGFVFGHMSHVTIVHAAAWSPFVFWALEALRRRAGAGATAGLGLAVAGCLLSGHPQVPLYTLILAGLYTLVHLPGAPAGWWRFGAAAAAGVGLGVGLVGLQFLPTAELVRLSVRAEMTYETFIGYSLPASQWPMLLFPHVYGGRYPLLGVGDWTGYVGKFNSAEVSGFAGLFALVLGGFGVLSTLRSRTTWFWLAVAAFGVAAAMGDDTPVGKVLYQVPAVNKFRAQGRFLFCADFAVAALSGVGAAALGRPRSWGGAARLLAAAGGVAALAAVAVDDALGQIRGGFFATHAPWLQATSPVMVTDPLRNQSLTDHLGPLALGVAVAVVGYAARFRWLPGVAAACVLLDMTAFAVHECEWRTNTVPPEATACPPLWESLKPELSRDGGYRVSSFQIGLPSEGVPPNLNALWGVPNVYGYTPLEMKAYGKFLDAFMSRQVIDQLAVKYVVLPVKPDGLTAEYGGVRWWFRPMGMPPLWNPAFNPPGQPAIYRDGYRFSFAGLRATRVAVETCAWGPGAAELADGAVVAEMTVRGADGTEVVQPLRAGIETAAAHRAPPAVIKHALPPVNRVSKSYGDAPDMTTTITVVPLGRGRDLSELRFRWVAGPLLSVHRISLIDDDAKRTVPLDGLTDQPERWVYRGLIPEAVLCENLRPSPPARLVADVRVLPADKLLPALHAGVFPDGRRFTLDDLAVTDFEVAGVDPLPAGTAASPEAVGTAAVSGRAPDRVWVQTKAPAGRLLVLSDTYYPGWEAKIDGAPAEVIPVNAVARGVVVPGGQHLVTFRYRPLSFRVGVAVTAAAGFATLLLLAAAAVRRGRPRRAAGPGEPAC